MSKFSRAVKLFFMLVLKRLITLFFRSRTAAMSTVGLLLLIPYSLSLAIRKAAAALARIVLVGVHPSLIHVPPRRPFSTNATFHPVAARREARGLPACPEPIIIATYCFILLF